MQLVTASESTCDDSFSTMAIVWFVFVYLLVSVECPRGSHDHVERDLDEGNWIKLGCFEPFRILGNSRISTSVDISTCATVTCNRTQCFYAIRGAQCIGFTNGTSMTRISDDYCDLSCSTSGFQCGGNFGATIYCHVDNKDCLGLVNQTEQLVDYPVIEDFPEVANCLNVGCGAMSHRWDPYTIIDYFPNMTTLDCVTFCTYKRKPYALLGWNWNAGVISGTRFAVPQCACSSRKLPSDEPCDGFCYDVANKKKTIDQPCGHPQQFNSSWSVFCTAYAINDTECAPFSSNFSREDVCPSSRPTDPLSSTLICASSPYIFDSEEIELNCENPGPCHPRSCYFNDTCYHYIGVEYKHNDDDLQKMADDRCRDANEGGRLLAIESEREQHFVADTFAQFASVAPYLLTAGRMEHGRFFWFGSADEEADQGIPDWVTQLVNDTDKCGSRAAYLYLSRPDIITEPYSVWNISCANISKHVCEYPPPSSPQCTPPTTPNTRGTQRTSTNTATVSIYWSTDPAPEATEPPTNCSGNGPFAAGDSCIPEYFVCRNGTAISQLCPVGLVFHPEIRQCVSEAACRDVTSSSTPNWTTEPSSEMTALPPTTLELTSQSTTTPSTTTESTTTPSTTTPSTTTESTTTPSTTTESTTTPSTTTESTTTPSTTTESATTPSTTTESATTSSTTTESTTTPSTTTKSTASSELTSVPTSKATTTPKAPICHCRQLDAYGTEWTSQVDTWATRPCSDTVLDAAGTARWLCRAIPEGGCAFEGSQPDYNDCRTQGLQDIDQNVDNVSVDVVDIWATLNETTHWSNGYFGHEIHWILAVVEKLLDRQENEFQGTDDSLWRQTRTQLSATDVIGNLIANDHQWHQLPQDNRSSIAIHLVDVGEDVAFRLARAAQSVNRSLQCETGSQNGHVILSSSFWDGRQSQLSDCELEAMAPAPSDVILRFPRSEAASSFLQLPTGAIAQGRIHAGAGLLIDHHVLDEVLPGRTNSFGGRSKRFNSPLVSYTLKFAPESTFEDDYVYVYHEHWLESKNPPVRKIRRYLKPGEVASPVLGSTACAFLRSSAPGRPEWHWSSDGCSLDSSNRTHTVCKCSHLTGFANLMDFHNYTGLSLGLEVTSIVCSSLSVVALVTTLVLLSVLKAIKNDRTVITQNLCAALMLTHILVLTTLNKNYFDLDDVTCAVFGIVLHLSLLISFMWTSVEGLRLCHLVINVFDQQKQNLTMFYALLAYGIPFIIVAATVLVANFSDGGIFYAYVGDEACWLSGGEYKWAFAGPVAFVLLLNVIFIIVAVHFSWNLKKNDTKRTAEKVKNSARLCLSLTGLLGISWLTGYFMYVESDVFAYIFTISNGLQGVVILLFRCLLNNSVQGAIRDQWRRKRRNNILQRQVRQSASTANVLRRRAENSTDRDQEKPITLPAARISSQMSVWSNMTRSTDLSSLSSDSPSPNQGPVNYFNEHRPKVRTFSGTEFSESSSEERNSICSGLSTTTSPSFDCGIKLDCPH